jgi:hypothetical protein
MRNKPDWNRFIDERLSDLNLPSDAKAQVIAELAAHLEDSEEASDPVLDAVSWPELKLAIEYAKHGEETMNHRTKSLWLPGFVSLIGAVLFMFAEEIVLAHDSSFYFMDRSLRPSQLISGLPFWFYLGWLFALVLCGALGAFVSQRNGGTRAARMVAGAFPALVMFLLCGLVIPVSALFERNDYVFRHPAGLALGILIWAAGPGLALLLGASPFLKEQKPTTA